MRGGGIESACGRPALVGQQPRQLRRRVRRAVPDEVVEAVPRAKVVTGPADRIAKHLLAGGQAEGEVFEEVAVHVGRKGALRDERRARRRSRHRAAARSGRSCARTLGPEPVRRDEEVARLARAVGEVGHDLARALLDPCELLAEAIMLIGKAVPQHPEELVPGGRDLRAGVLADDAPVPVEGAPHGDRHAEVGADIDPGQGERRAQLRMRHDAGAAPAHRHRRALEDRRLPAMAAQQQAGEQPAHRAADDERPSLTPRHAWLRSCHSGAPRSGEPGTHKHQRRRTCTSASARSAKLVSDGFRAPASRARNDSA